MNDEKELELQLQMIEIGLLLLEKGGQGSGCSGDNCGRPRGSSGADRKPSTGTGVMANRRAEREEREPGQAVRAVHSTIEDAEYTHVATPSGLIKVEEGGTLKLKQPKTAEEATNMLKDMSNVTEQAMKDVEKYKGDANKEFFASLRLDHVKKQMARAIGMGKKVADKAKKDANTELLDLLEKLIAKYGEPDYSETDPELGG